LTCRTGQVLQSSIRPKLQDLITVFLLTLQRVAHPL